jgi:hypothetical protein
LVLLGKLACLVKGLQEKLRHTVDRKPRVFAPSAFPFPASALLPVSFESHFQGDVSGSRELRSTGCGMAWWYTHPMKSAAQLEKEVLSLPAEERARLALAAWESLEAEPAFAADRTLDPEGVALALERDAEIEAGSVKLLSSVEFRQRTAGPKR